MKYSLACPDIPVWGLDRSLSNRELWITEGIFDTMALTNLGKIYCKNIADKFNSSFSKISGEDISSLFFKYLEWLPHDAEFIEGDLVIWGNFEDVARKRRISS